MVAAVQALYHEKLLPSPSLIGRKLIELFPLFSGSQLHHPRLTEADIVRVLTLLFLYFPCLLGVHDLPQARG